jgi:hypothetical protein
MGPSLEIGNSIVRAPLLPSNFLSDLGRNDLTFSSLLTVPIPSLSNNFSSPRHGLGLFINYESTSPHWGTQRTILLVTYFTSLSYQPTCLWVGTAGSVIACSVLRSILPAIEAFSSHPLSRNQPRPHHHCLRLIAPIHLRST